MKRFAAAIVLLFAPFMFPGVAQAQVEVSFPLGEHYRVGRYLPVRLNGQVNGVVRVAASGAVPTEMPGGNAVVPLLAIAPLGEVTSTANARIGTAKQVLLPLRDDQRLIGITTNPNEADALAADLFPGKQIIRVSLDLADPLPGAVMAWGALDAVLLDASAAARVTESQLAMLLAAGTAVAIQSDTRPGSGWPWQRRGAWWVLPPDDAAVVRLVQPDRYGPTDDALEAPVRFRQVIVTSLACFAIAVLAASLSRDRRVWVVVVLLSVGTAGAIAWWNGKQPTSAELLTEKRLGPWLGHYTQHVARADGQIRHPIRDADAAAWPILFSPRQGQDVELTLECRADGMPAAFVARLRRGQSLVFLNRSLAPPATPAPSTAAAPAIRPK